MYSATDLRILEFLSRQERCVTFRDIAKAMDLAVSNTYEHMLRLRRAGLVTWDTGKQRTIRLVKSNA